MAKKAKKVKRSRGTRPARAAAKKRVMRGAKRTSARRVTRRRAPAPKRSAARRPPAVRKVRPGTITHSELASADPIATRVWCETVLGWEFGAAMPTPTGPYHMWRFDNGTGGGIRANNPPEVPGTIPYCEVEDIQATFGKALQAGATEMLGPQALPGGMGWVAIVAAPGGVAIGFWAQR
jgi:predicted enzyme related to lactoylglutathione lyase